MDQRRLDFHGGGVMNLFSISNRIAIPAGKFLLVNLCPMNAICATIRCSCSSRFFIEPYIRPAKPDRSISQNFHSGWELNDAYDLEPLGNRHWDCFYSIFWLKKLFPKKQKTWKYLENERRRGCKKWKNDWASVCGFCIFPRLKNQDTSFCQSRLYENFSVPIEF